LLCKDFCFYGEATAPHFNAERCKNMRLFWHVLDTRGLELFSASGLLPYYDWKGCMNQGYTQDVSVSTDQSIAQIRRTAVAAGLFAWLFIGALPLLTT
jgi:hypothetical protein